jgi:hypothetical protein
LKLNLTLKYPGFLRYFCSHANTKKCTSHGGKSELEKLFAKDLFTGETFKGMHNDVFKLYLLSITENQILLLVN